MKPRTMLVCFVTAFIVCSLQINLAADSDQGLENALRRIRTEGVSQEFSLDTVDPVLNLISPDGLEQYPAGSSQNVTWTCFDSHLSSYPIQADWTSDSGENWSVLVASIENSGAFTWVIPNQTTTNAMIRLIATDSFGNVSTDISNSVFSIIPADPSSPLGVNAVLSGTDIVITWTPVNTTIFGNPLVVDSYTVIYSSRADAPISEWAVLGSVQISSITHPDAAADYPKLFYRVIANKDYRLPLINGDGKLKSTSAGKLTTSFTEYVDDRDCEPTAKAKKGD